MNAKVKKTENKVDVLAGGGADNIEHLHFQTNTHTSFKQRWSVQNVKRSSNPPSSRRLASSARMKCTTVRRLAPSAVATKAKRRLVLLESARYESMHLVLMFYQNVFSGDIKAVTDIVCRANFSARRPKILMRLMLLPAITAK